MIVGVLPEERLVRDLRGFRPLHFLNAYPNLHPFIDVTATAVSPSARERSTTLHSLQFAIPHPTLLGLCLTDSLNPLYSA